MDVFSFLFPPVRASHTCRRTQIATWRAALSRFLAFFLFSSLFIAANLLQRQRKGDFSLSSEREGRKEKEKESERDKVSNERSK